MKTPVTIYVVHHPECKEAQKLARQMYDWFRFGYLTGDSSAAGLPVYFRRRLAGSKLEPAIELDAAGLNVVVILVDHWMVGEEAWRNAIVEFANTVEKLRHDKAFDSQVILLPTAIHESFYRTGPLYKEFNPIRLLDMNEQQMEATLRRSVTEATARQYC